MKMWALISIGSSALALAACVPPQARQPHFASLKPISRLDCPNSEGELTRTSVSADGTSCTYAAGDNVVVQLKLTSVSGDPQEALAPIEADLRKMATFEPSAPPSGAPAESSAPPASSWSDKDEKDDGGRDVNINLPGLHIQAQDNGAAHINVAGIHIDADDKTNSAHIEGHHHGFMGHGGGNFTVDANDSGAIIRSHSVGPNVRQDLILASEKPGPDGWRAVGYDAQGPKSGPLVVAIVQSKSDEHDRLFGDVRRLVDRVARG
jgi:hypothetical protein